MALPAVTFTGNGTVGPYAVPFPYIAPEHVHVFINGLPVGFSFLTASTIELDAPASVGAAGLIRRITPQDAPLVDWANGANINEESLDLQTLQLLYIAQESAAAELQADLTELAAAVTASQAAAATATTKAAEAETSAGIASANGLGFFRAFLGGL